jgi:adenylyltransferase/sulfurtransferase
MLSKEERTRYSRQLLITDIGKAGQEKLKSSKVFVSGLGGLGSVITLYLAAAGVGTLRIVDKGKVELSNLNRQILYGSDDIGKRKAEAARKKLERLNPNIKIEAMAQTITERNAIDLIDDSDLIVDGLDNYATRYILNRVALRKKIPFFYGAVRGFQGMLTSIIPGKTGCLRCLVPTPPAPSLVPIMGVTPAMIGCLQTTEVIKYIVGLGELFMNRMLLFDSLNLKFEVITFKKRETCPDCGEYQEKRKGHGRTENRDVRKETRYDGQ